MHSFASVKSRRPRHGIKNHPCKQALYNYTKCETAGLQSKYKVFHFCLCSLLPFTVILLCFLEAITDFETNVSDKSFIEEQRFEAIIASLSSSNNKYRYVGYTCRLYMPTLTPTHWRAQGVHDWSTHERAWRRYRESRWLLQSTKEMSKQIRVSIVWNALYKRHSTINEQAIGLDTC